MKYQIKNNLLAAFLFSLSVSAITGRERLIRKVIRRQGFAWN